MQMQTKTSHCDAMKGQYANQMLKVSLAYLIILALLLKKPTITLIFPVINMLTYHFQTNDARNRFYGQLLPSVLNELQRMEETRIALLTQSVREMIHKEREIAPIITKCVDSIEEATNDVVPESDTAMVAEKYKVT